jgi:hypothetical protein
MPSLVRKVATGNDPERNVADLVSDLGEDLATRWAADPLADGDLEEQLLAPGLDLAEVKFLSVPRQTGPARNAIQLSGRAMGFMRQAVFELREFSDLTLDPAVCGYRTGAAGAVRYDQEYRRYREMSLALAEHSPFVLSIDLKNFFGTIVRKRVGTRMRARYGDRWLAVDDLLARLEELGIHGLPAGYGDSRLIANAILAEVDESINCEFTRWVDDYRIGVHSESHAAEVIDKVDLVLSRLGLELNHEKTILRVSPEFAGTMGASLDSVYHPGDETDDLVCAQLRQVFIRAVTQDNRRLLRFSLPRLAIEGDDIALEHCFNGLSRNDIDSPRMADYISHFSDDQRVAKFLATSLGRFDDWALVRALPLVPKAGLWELRRSLREYARSSGVGLVADLATRALALLGDAHAVVNLVESGTDPRVAIASCLDLDLSIPQRYAERAAPTMTAARRGTFPPPSTETIL